MASLLTAINWAITTCNRNDVGYSQTYRNERKVNGITYYDCSSFIWYALKSGQFDVESAYRIATGNNYNGNAITTYYERAWLQALGFTQENIQGEWKQGDILWRSGHTEMVYSGGIGQGITMGAHSSNYSLPNQVSINSNPSTYNNWTTLYRYNGPDVRTDISIYVVSAICGNFYQESGINPAMWENLSSNNNWTDLNVGYGLGQWTNTDGNPNGRLYQLYDYLTTHSYPIDSGEGQLEYLQYENVWYSTQEASAFANLQEFLHSGSTDITMLTHAFNIGWEGIHDSSWDARVQYANDCYNFILDHWNDLNIYEWKKGNTYLSTQDRLNNAVMVYRYLTNNTPPQPTPPTPEFRTKKMPLWMMIRHY